MADAISLIIDINDESDKDQDQDQDNSINTDISNDEKTKTIKKFSITIAKPVKTSQGSHEEVYSGRSTSTSCNDITNTELPFIRDVRLSDPVDVLKRITEIDAVLDIIMHDFNYQEAIDKSMAMKFFNKCVSRRNTDSSNNESCEKTISVYEIENKFGFLEHYIDYSSYIKDLMNDESVKSLVNTSVFIDMIVSEGNRLSRYFEDLEFLQKTVDAGSLMNNSLYFFFMKRFGDC